MAGDIRDLAPATVRTRLALVALLVGTALTYLWSLDRNGWANTYYAAAVQAGVHSWKSFFFASFDAGNFITLDKPPVSLWVMALSGRLFGFSSWSMLVPQALLGVGSVALLYAVVRRVWGSSAGLLAGVALAVTPVAALMFRFNNPDAALTFLLILGAWTLTRALERGRIWWLLATGAALGFAFLTKELQALLVLPGFAVTYLVAGPPRLVVRVGQLLAAGAVLVVSGLWWPVLVDAIPAADRPYIGGSTTNSVLELAFGFNGLGRITGNGNGAGPGPFPGGGSAPADLPKGGPPGGGQGGPGPGFGGETGFDRLFNDQFGGMSAWLIPAAVVGLLAGLWLIRRTARTDPRRASLVLWGSWLVVTAGVLSFAGGIIHSYYTVALAPAVAACAAMVLPALWRARAGWWSRLVLALMGVATSATAYLLLGRAPDWLPWLRWTVLACGLACAAALLLLGGRDPAIGFRPAGAAGEVSPGRAVRRVPAAVVVATAAVAGLAVSAGLVAPLAWSLATVNSAHAGGNPTAGPAQAMQVGGGLGPGGPAPLRADGQLPDGQLPDGQLPDGQLPGEGGFPGNRSGTGPGAAQESVPVELASLLRDAGGQYTWSAAAASSMTAGPLELASGTAVMSLGGFGGQDRAITSEQFKAYVAGQRVRYYVTGGGPEGLGGRGGPGGPGGPGGFGGGPGGSPAGAGGRGGDERTSSIGSWVSSIYEARTIGGFTVYDLGAPRRSASSATS